MRLPLTTIAPIRGLKVRDMEYHKIDTLFERDEKFAVDTERLRHPVIGTISQWDVTEKHCF